MKTRDIILGLIIAFIFLFFCIYGTKLMYKEPRWDRYCNDSYYTKPYMPDKNMSDAEMRAQEAYYTQCQKAFEGVNKGYAKNLFVTSLALCVLIVIICFAFVKVEAVSSGLMLGSLFFMIYGTTNYFQYMEDFYRFAVLGIALVILIYIAYKIGNKKDKK